MNSTFFTHKNFRYSDDLFNIWKESQDQNEIITSEIKNSNETITIKNYKFSEAPDILKEIEYIKDIDKFFHNYTLPSLKYK